MIKSPNETIDQTLTVYRELQAQFAEVRDRLRRAETQRHTVHRRVYDKVRAEYDRELDALRARMTPLRAELDALRGSCEEQMRTAVATLEAVEETLAEAAFRHQIGEYSEAQIRERRDAIDGDLSAARERVEMLRHSLKVLDGMDSHEDAAAPPVTPPAASPAPPPVEPPAPVLPVGTTAPGIDANDALAAFADAPDASPADAPATVEVAAPAEATAPDETAAGTRRPTLRARTSGNATPAFENPHDWIDEIATEPARRAEPAPEGQTPRPARGIAASTSAPTIDRPLPSLVFVSGPYAGQALALLPTTLTIGREHDNNIEIKDPEVARYHARILFERGEYTVEDMEGSAGTWVNGQKSARAALKHGDVIRIGQTEIAIDFEWTTDSR